MTNTLTTFRQQKEKTISLFEKLKDFINLAQKNDIPIDFGIIKKLEGIIDDIHQDDNRLKIALIGGFSEGKTTIAAAWMEKFDKDSMKISQQESSDAVNIYPVDNDFLLVDTPGLFGFKEENNNGNVQKYKEITRKWVSQSHIVLYIMNSANPIKDSHKEELNWLFRTLNLLPRTVFVLSKFDEVADVGDKQDYEENLQIKQSNVQIRLKSLLNLSEEEEKALMIVGVSANPFNMGIEYWLKEMDRFKAISYIETLQHATNEIIKKNSASKIIMDAQKSIIQDILTNYLPIIEARIGKTDSKTTQLIKNQKESKDELEEINKKIIRTQADLKNFLDLYFNDLITQVQNCNIDTIINFLQTEIGDEGKIMSIKIENKFREHIGAVSFSLDTARLQFNSNFKGLSTPSSDIGNQAISLISQSNIFTADNVKLARDGIVGLMKIFGIDIGLKFKPWGAINLAKNLNGALAIFGIAMNVWDAYSTVQKEEEFKNKINEIINNLRTLHEELVGVVIGNEFAQRFFPAYIEMEKGLNNIEFSKEKINKQKDDLTKLLDLGNSLKTHL
ncbi:LeoA/HP0731 family dynamin-like GTPase [Cardiobacterium valvarum]|uniref:G domain-containing protein n=1 Tax=Cardiobacterium valvarum F0432 TaxID=797473 RepID=G9ZHF0_9GAMM|nr:LeoA/HP0731 family dynamin-like GTPase [Cardiobacterium valvarum]EHM52629.1 hypothetical protein HMPREF9080_02184 [Cardiobacterium valvarum F0432]